MVKLGSINSRMKDFYDIWIISRQFDFKGERFIKSVKKTFSTRKTKLPTQAKLFAEEFYDGTSDRQVMWKAFLTKNNLSLASEKLNIVIKTIESFLRKPIKAIHDDIKFDYTWKAPGPWE